MIIDLKLNDGETIEIYLRSKDLIINGQHYKATDDYYYRISEIFHLLSKEYEMKTN